jgi:hypothetical protein
VAKTKRFRLPEQQKAFHCCRSDSISKIYQHLMVVEGKPDTGNGSRMYCFVHKKTIELSIKMHNRIDQCLAAGISLI